MKAIRIHKQLESETLYLPELKPLVGKRVEIIVQEESAPAAGTGNWADLEQLAHELKDYDFDAWREQRDLDLKHAKEHSP
ncbi:MAG TPA: hypothetical protein VND64_16495 [Pirellulales bacterium]|nr:hypothetical protein [Pirellulales bacterium]